MTSNEHLQEIISRLPEHLQEEVASYAQYLLQKNQPEPEETPRPRFYICPICFSASKVRLECHGYRMITCNAENPEDCKPPMTADGELKGSRSALVYQFNSAAGDCIEEAISPNLLKIGN